MHLGTIKEQPDQDQSSHNQQQSDKCYITIAHANKKQSHEQALKQQSISLCDRQSVISLLLMYLAYLAMRYKNS